MPDDFDITSLFGPIDTDAAKIDTKHVIRRARARRLPAQLAVGGGVLATAGVLVLGATVGLSALSTNTSASTSSVAAAPEAAAPTPEQLPASGNAAAPVAGAATGDKRSSTDTLNLCGSSLAEGVPSATGLVLTPHFPDANAGAASVTGTVTLTNTSNTRWIGSTASSPVITLSQHGVVLWHTAVLDDSARVIDLAPGESTDYTAHLSPVICAVEDDANGFRADLPHVAAGDYQVSAAIDVPGDELSDLVTGPEQTITLK